MEDMRRSLISAGLLLLAGAVGGCSWTPEQWQAFDQAIIAQQQRQAMIEASRPRVFQNNIYIEPGYKRGGFVIEHGTRTATSDFLDGAAQGARGY